jgi:hypothetical protein
MAYINSLLSTAAGRRIGRIIAHRAKPFKPTYGIEEWQKTLGQKMAE